MYLLSFLIFVFFFVLSAIVHRFLRGVRGVTRSFFLLFVGLVLFSFFALVLFLFILLHLVFLIFFFVVNFTSEKSKCPIIVLSRKVVECWLCLRFDEI